HSGIIAELGGPTGHGVGAEIDADLASRARDTLSDIQHTEVVQGDGGEYDSGPCDAIFINAGATHPRSLWLDSLRPGGRLVLYLTVAFDDTAAGKGGMLKVIRKDKG